MIKQLQSVLVVALALGLFCGCKPAMDPKKKPADDHGHDHGHDHAHSHASHEAHEIHLTPGGEHVSWAHDEEAETVTITMEELISGGTKVDKVRIELEVGKEKRSYDLASEKVDSKKIEGSVYSIRSPELVTALEVEGVKAKVIISSGDKEFSAALEHSDDEHHH